MTAFVYKHEYHINSHDSPVTHHVTKYVNFPIHTNLGAPTQNDCYDVIQHSGKYHRTKSIKQILQKLRNTHASGVRRVFSPNDNFQGNKRFSKERVKSVISWNVMVAASKFSVAIIFLNLWNYQ